MGDDDERRRADRRRSARAGRGRRSRDRSSARRGRDVEAGQEQRGEARPRCLRRRRARDAADRAGVRRPRSAHTAPARAVEIGAAEREEAVERFGVAASSRGLVRRAARQAGRAPARPRPRRSGARGTRAESPPARVELLRQVADAQPGGLRTTVPPSGSSTRRAGAAASTCRRRSGRRRRCGPGPTVIETRLRTVRAPWARVTRSSVIENWRNAERCVRAGRGAPPAPPSGRRRGPPRARAAVVEVLAADGAEPRAVGPAEDLVGQREHDRVARPGGQVELVVVDVRATLLLGGLVAVGLVLARRDRHVEHRILEAPEARAVQPHAELSSNTEPLFARVIASSAGTSSGTGT